MQAAQHLDHNPNFGVAQDEVERLGEFVLVGAAGKIVSVQYVFDVDFFLRAGGDNLRVLIQHFNHAGTDGAIPQNRNLYHNRETLLVADSI